MTWRLAEGLNPAGRVQNALAAGLLGLTTPFIQWSASGMDTPLFTLLVTAAVAAYVGFRQGALPAWSVGGIFCLAALTRPEGAMLFAATLAFDVAGRVFYRKRVIDRNLLMLAGAFLLPYAVYFAWRWRYFGYPFPNTFYAKTGGGAAQWQGGLQYLARSLELLLGGTAGVLILPLLFARWRAAKGAGCDYLATLVVISWLATAAEGGDHFGMARFLMPTLPLLFILLASGLSRLLMSDAVPARASPVILLIVLAAALNHWQPWSWAQRSIRVPAADASAQQPLTLSLTTFVMMGQALREIAQPGDTIAAVPVGAIGYFSGMDVIDMVGIVDPVIAHRPFDPTYTASWRPGHDKGDGAYILSRRPTYIQLRDQLTSRPVAGPDDHALQYRSIVEIWAADEFHRSYRFYPVRVTGGWYYNLYLRIDDFAEQDRQ